jgi:hypothetical protein
MAWPHGRNPTPIAFDQDTPGPQAASQWINDMPANNPTSVSLDVRDFASTGDGWTNVTASNGKPYSYKYTGGNQPADDGSVEFASGQGNAAVTLSLIADGRYQIASNGVTFLNDPQGQLAAQGNAPRTRVINDSCSAPLQASYKVSVIDTQDGNASIACDPFIINR